MAQETIEKCLKHNWYGDDFVVGKEKDKLLDNKKVYYEKESGKWYIMDTIIEPMRKRNGSLVKWKQKQENERLKNILII